jgi:hypothetical protein
MSGVRKCPEFVNVLLVRQLRDVGRDAPRLIARDEFRRRSSARLLL